MNALALVARAVGGPGESVALVSARLRDSAEIEPVEHDLAAFRPDWEGRFDLVRAANVLNLSYFSRTQLESMVRHLMRYLSDGGLLAVVRTDEETGRHDASVFLKTPDGRALCVDELGKGSEIRDIVLSAGPGGETDA